MRRRRSPCARPGPAAPQLGVGDEPFELGGERRGVVAGGEQAVHAVLDQLGHAALVGADDGLARRPWPRGTRTGSSPTGSAAGRCRRPPTSGRRSAERQRAQPVDRSLERPTGERRQQRVGHVAEEVGAGEHERRRRSARGSSAAISGHQVDALAPFHPSREDDRQRPPRQAVLGVHVDVLGRGVEPRPGRGRW